MTGERDAQVKSWQDVELMGLRRDVDHLFQQHDRLNTSVASEYRSLREKMESNRRDHDKEHADQNKVIGAIQQSINDIHTETMLRKQQRENKESSKRWTIGIIVAAIPVIITLLVIGVNWLDTRIQSVVIVKEQPK